MKVESVNKKSPELFYRSIQIIDTMDQKPTYTTQLEQKINKGGKIVIPKHIPRSGTSWENPNRGQIPLDRAGKHLPRYMQETNVSKTKLAFKHTDQNNAREHRKHSRAAKNQAVDLVGQHRQLVTQVKNLSVRLILISSSHYILSMISTSSKSSNPIYNQLIQL